MSEWLKDVSMSAGRAGSSESRIYELEAEVERLREARQSTFGLAVEWQDEATRLREALERIGSYVGEDGLRYCGVCGYNFDACRVACSGRLARAALDGGSEDD